jgi:hypothetical protein
MAPRSKVEKKKSKRIEAMKLKKLGRFLDRKPALQLAAPVQTGHRPDTDQPLTETRTSTSGWPLVLLRLTGRSGLCTGSNCPQNQALIPRQVQLAAQPTDAT